MRPKFKPPVEKFLALQVDSASLNEKEDCAVKAVAAVTDAPYSEVHTIMAQLGRKPRSGTPMEITNLALNRLGFRMESVPSAYFTSRYRGKARVVTTHQPDRFPHVWRDGCNYLLRTNGHILAVVNGDCVDWTRGRSLVVREVYRVTRRHYDVQ